MPRREALAAPGMARELADQLVAELPRAHAERSANARQLVGTVRRHLLERGGSMVDTDLAVRDATHGSTDDERTVARDPASREAAS